MARLTYALVLVVWHDAHAVSEWLDPDDIDADPYVVHTVGHLIPDAKPGHIVIGQSVGSDGALDGILYVPAGMVQHLKIIHHTEAAIP